MQARALEEALGQLLADGHIDVRDGSEVEQNIEDRLKQIETDKQMRSDEQDEFRAVQMSLQSDCLVILVGLFNTLKVNDVSEIWDDCYRL